MCLERLNRPEDSGRPAEEVLTAYGPGMGVQPCACVFALEGKTSVHISSVAAFKHSC